MQFYKIVRSMEGRVIGDIWVCGRGIGFGYWSHFKSFFGPKKGPRERDPVWSRCLRRSGSGGGGDGGGGLGGEEEGGFGEE